MLKSIEKGTYEGKGDKPKQAIFCTVFLEAAKQMWDDAFKAHIHTHLRSC